jgi:beta-1,4-mannosyl-glycoprotein beta-1,4-N-acetylglucosaminyltransferase
VIFDTFMFGNDYEFDVLTCRLYELQNVPGLVHVAVEADVDHQAHPKPYHLSDNLGRFAEWGDRLRVVRATGLPTLADSADAWSREQAQREYARHGMTDAQPGDVILHGDLDEIPTALVTRNVRPRGMVAFEQRGHFFAVDWAYPHPWRGTVATTVERFRSFNAMRDARNVANPIHNAGWHLSWLGGPVINRQKLNSFCHPECADQIDYGLKDGRNAFLELGLHVDGTKMTPVDVDASWPRWVYERKCPANWFRPRGDEVAA